MAIYNQDIAALFKEMADLLEIDAANPFRVRAYRNAARTIGDLTEELGEKVEAGSDLIGIDGVGKDLAAKIEEIVRTGTLSALQEIHEKIPPGIGELLKLPGLGPKKVKVLYEDLGITSLDSLEKAAQEGKLEQLPGLGKKSQEKLLKAVASRRDMSQRFRRADVMPYAEGMVKQLREADPDAQFCLAGSYRRACETVGDLDILAESGQAGTLMDAFVQAGEVTEILAHGKTKSSVLLRNGLQIDLRVVPPESFGAALHYFTGSKAHNIAVRRRARQMGLKVNEYGIFRGEDVVGGDTEASVFGALNLSEIPPELREGRGEIEAAAGGLLPALVERKDMKGDLHTHSTASDGNATIAEMAAAAKEAGHDYMAVTDHTKRLTIANGLDEERLHRQIDEIDELNGTLEGFAVLKGSEVDILEDGSLDLADDVLERLDLVVGSVHSLFNLRRDAQTERILRAMDHPFFTFLGHPTGRLILSREPYEVDVPRVIEHAAQRGCYLELNANPKRLDLSDIHCSLARELGILIAVNTDAHRTRDFGYMIHGIGQARRGGLQKKDVLNTRPLASLRKLLEKTRLS